MTSTSVRYALAALVFSAFAASATPGLFLRLAGDAAQPHVMDALAYDRYLMQD